MQDDSTWKDVTYMLKEKNSFLISNFLKKLQVAKHLKLTKFEKQLKICVKIS